MALTFRSLHLDTTNLTRQKTFYEALGFRCSGIQRGEFKLFTKKTEITFHESSQNEAYHFCFLVSPHMFAVLEERLRKLEIKILAFEGKDIIHMKGWNSDSLYFFDADGHIAEFIVHHTLKHDREDNNQVVQLAEMGLVSKEILNVSETICSRLDVKPYCISGSRFQDVGLPGTMFILCNPVEKFTWYPTEMEPKSISCRGSVEKDGVLHRFVFDGQYIKFL